jgi:hypothetical protein
MRHPNTRVSYASNTHNYLYAAGNDTRRRLESVEENQEKANKQMLLLGVFGLHEVFNNPRFPTYQ